METSSITNILAFGKTLSFLTDKDTRFEEVEAIREDLREKTIEFNLN